MARLEKGRDLMNEKLIKDMEFIVELDKMKNVYRMTDVIGQNRKENDAEHSWHISIMAMILSEYSNEDIDLLKVIKMLLIHDLVEIHAGDTFCYDQVANGDKKERELIAAEKIYGMLDKKKGQELRKLWDEFEEEISPEAKFAASMDRLQPILNNYYNGGGTWKEFGIKESQVYKRVAPVKETSEDIWEYLDNLLQDAIERKLVKRD